MGGPANPPRPTFVSSDDAAIVSNAGEWYDSCDPAAGPHPTRET